MLSPIWFCYKRTSYGDERNINKFIELLYELKFIFERWKQQLKSSNSHFSKETN